MKKNIILKKNNKKNQFGQPIYCLAWDNLNEILYCGQREGKINRWNFKTDTEDALDNTGAHSK